jgi:signal transduction histidine kinase
VDSERRLIDLQAAVAKLEVEQRQLRDFLILVCHELKHPLSTIQAHADLLQRYEDYKDKAAEGILGKVSEMERLIGDLLFVTRLENAQLRLHTVRANLVDLVTAAAYQAQALAPDHRLGVEAPKAVLEGWLDADRLNQVLQNLLSNAVKYSPAGGQILLRVDQVADEFRVSVSDQGIGIDGATLPHLFERFFRTEAAQVSMRGLGMGLYVSRLLVQAHGGRIWAESAGSGKGSTFVFTLPSGQADGRER